MRPAPPASDERRIRRGAILSVILSLVGLAACAYLGFLHLALLKGELLGGLGCHATGTFFNCHAVTASPYGKAFGVPLAFWGAAGYIATFSLALIAWQFRESAVQALTLLTALSGLFLVIDAGLLTLMVTKIRHLCLLCLLTDAVNLWLLLVARWALGQRWTQVARALPAAWGWLSLRSPVAWIFWGMVGTGLTGVLTVHSAAQFVGQGNLAQYRQNLQEHLRREPRVVVDTAGSPRRGPEQAPIQIVEFSDFLCPLCQQAARFETILLAGRRREVALVYKFFPLDTDCNASIQNNIHPQACRVAAAAACAHAQGKFWDFHNLLFEKGPAYLAGDLEADAVKAGLDLAAFRACLGTGQGLAMVRRDIAEAARLGVNSTPTYWVNGVRILGLIPPAAFEELVRALKGE